MPLAPGIKLGPYEILAPLGAGGMGEVYRARDTRLGREVAVKILPTAVSQDAERLARFELEASSTSELNHPNILGLHDVGRQDGTSFIITELLEGSSLREMLSGAPLAQRKAIEYALQIARGLAAAHRRQIVHRDLKPENLFVTADGVVKILDFGLAKRTGVSPGAGTEAPTVRVNTDPGAVMGTAGYMSPEQVQGRAADHRSDIFSFGCVLYEMLAGRRAFGGASAVETMNAILKEEPPELSTLCPGLAPAVERTVSRCLEKKPEDRFQSASDLAFALEALSGSNITSQAGPSAATPPAKASAWGARMPWLVAALCAVAAALAVTSLYPRRGREGARAVRLTIPPPAKGTVSTLSVSPDGRRVVYAAPDAEGRVVLWLRSLDDLDAHPLPGTESPSFAMFWSPDSRFVGFISSADNKLKKIDVTGGQPQTIADAPSGRGGTWNRDGVILFGSISGPLFRVSASGGAVTPVTALDESHLEYSHRYPHFLPDGRHFLFFARSPGTALRSAVCVGALNSKQTKRLLSAESGAVYSPPGYLLFMRGGVLMAQGFDAGRLELRGEAIPVATGVGQDITQAFARFSVSENGVLVYSTGGEFNTVQLAWVDRAGRQTGTVGPPGSYGFVRLSPDDSRAALSLRDPQTRGLHIWTMNLAGGNLTRLTFDTGNSEVAPVWSSDGTRLAFVSNQEGQLNFYQKLASGAGGNEELLKSSQAKFPTDWSPDGRFIAYYVLSGQTRADIWMLPLAGDRRPSPFLQTSAAELYARFSPDGRWVAYASDESGPIEVYVQSFPPGRGKWQVSNGGGGAPQWRRDGKELFYTNGDKLMAVEVNGGAETFEAGAPNLLFAIRSVVLPGAGNGPAFEASADGQRFLVALPVEEATTTPITVVLNWAAGLKR